MPNPTDYPQSRCTASFTINKDAVLSAAVDMDGCYLVALQVPSDFTGTTISLLGNGDGGTTVYALYTVTNSLVQRVVTTNSMVLFDAPTWDLRALRSVKIQASASQSTTVSLTAILLPV